MKRARLDRILGMIIATAGLGARGLACGPCPDTTEVIPLLPPSADGGAPDAEIDFDEACERHCSAGASDCEPTTIPAEGGGSVPALVCTFPSDCSAGRRPEGLAAPPPAAEGVGGWLAGAAFLEAASVDAFRALRRDLRALGAPRRLLRAASRAARDERRHARHMRAAARRYGARPPTPVVRPTATPDLAALAAHNAAEGCVRETFGALCARWQAAAAGDRELAAAMERIAAEEARHAALAFQVDAWARRRLDPAARARVDRARAEAARALLAEVAHEPSATLVRTLGLPDKTAAVHMARSLIAALRLL